MMTEENDEEIIEVYGKCASRRYFRNWLDNLPVSLRPIYEEEKRRIEEGLDSPPPLGTQPLKELVRSMHRREGAVIKYL
ncbi:unnamed protein product [Sphagnum jensenii]|uniref:Uncharacterized protein n=1 Tax=Sphagnum jensenii TaxID=128206 RepID=A0ABP0V8U9_9BRYO